MKIADRHDLQWDRRYPAMAPVATGRSFIELIEAGETGSGITSRRALGFGEAGILGLHHAVPLDRAASSSPGVPAPVAVAQSQDAAAMERLRPAVRIEVRIDDTAAAMSQQDADATTAKPVGVDAKGRHATFRSAALPTAPPLPGPGPDAIDVPTLPPPAARTAQPARRDLRFRVSVSGPTEATVILVEDDGRAEPGSEDFESRARAVAAEFGVTLKSFTARKYPPAPKPGP